MEWLIQGGQLIAALSLLVVLHEGGHFLFAKLFKTRVEKFYLFFDYKFGLFSTYSNWFRKLIGKKPVEKKENGEYEYEGTEYGIGWIPLGGYVKISGMIDESMDKDQMALPPQPWEFRTKKAWQRLFIMLGGVIMNFLTAFFIYAMVLFVWGKEYVKSTDMEYGMKFSEAAKEDGFCDGDIITYIDDEEVEAWKTARLQDISNAKTVTVLRKGKKVVINMPKNMSLLDMMDQEPIYADILLPSCIDSIIPGSPAEKAGLKVGDKITSINGNETKNHNDILYQILTLQDVLNKESTPEDSLKQRTVSIVVNGKDTINTVLTSEFKLGFTNKNPYENKITIKKYGFFEAFPAGIEHGWNVMMSYVDQLKYLFTKKGARSVGGFIGIGKIFSPVWDWVKFWDMTAFLSVALGVMNLLPIPALDGGHAIITVFEMCTGKKPSEKFLERIQVVGMWLLLALMVWANLNDILRLLGV